MLDYACNLQPDLIEAQGTHAIIGVRSADSRDDYQSTIAEVDTARKIIVIDEIFPSGFSAKPGQIVAVTLRLAGNRHSEFSTRLLAQQKHGAATRYLLALPEHMSYSQRRETFRFRVPQGLGTNAEFVTAERYFSSGILQDVSLNGVRIAMCNEIAMAVGDRLTPFRCEFVGKKFQCDAVVMNVHSDANGNRSIGVEFIAMPRSQQRELEQILARWHRERARRFAVERHAVSA